MKDLHSCLSDAGVVTAVVTVVEHLENMVDTPIAVTDSAVGTCGADVLYVCVHYYRHAVESSEQ